MGEEEEVAALMVSGKTGTCGVGMLRLCMVEACIDSKLLSPFLFLFRAYSLLSPFPYFFV